MFGDGGSGFRFVVARLAMAVVLIGGLMWWLMPGSGDEEFVDAQNALRAARSWRMQTAVETPAQSHTTVIEVSCPESDHRRTDVTFKDGHAPFRIEEIHIGLQGFEWQPSGEWKRRESEFGPGYRLCHSMKQGQDFEPMPPLALLLQRGVIRKGDEMNLNGETCREWTVQLAAGAGTLRTEKICIHPKDHLPRRRITAEATYLYSDWNTPIEITAPRTSDH